MSPTRRQPARDVTLEGRVARLESSVETLHKENGSIAATLASHGEAIELVRETVSAVDAKLERLVVMGERQQSQREALDRAFEAIGKQEGRLVADEQRIAGLEAHKMVVAAAGSGVWQIIIRAASYGVVATVTALIAIAATGGAR